MSFLERNPSIRLLIPGRSTTNRTDCCDESTNRSSKDLLTENVFLKNQLKDARDTITDQLGTIASLNEFIIRQQRAVDEFDTENEELIADMQDLIEENEHLLKELESAKASKQKVDEEKRLLKIENFTLLDRLEKKRLGWLEESEVEELKRQTKEPLIRKLEASRLEADALEVRVRQLDTDREGLAEQLAKASDRSSELLSSVSKMQKTIDELNKSYLQICNENSKLKSRIRTFDPSATFQDIPTPQIVCNPDAQLKMPERNKRKSFLEMIPSIPQYLFSPISATPKTTKQDLLHQSSNMGDHLNPRRSSVVGVISHSATLGPNKRLQRTSFSHPSMPVTSNEMKNNAIQAENSKQHLSVSRRQTFNVVPKQVDIKQTSNIFSAVNQVQQLFEAGELGDCSDADEDHQAISAGAEKDALTNAFDAVRNLCNQGDLSDYSSGEDEQDDNKIKQSQPPLSVGNAYNESSTDLIKVESVLSDKEPCSMAQNVSAGRSSDLLSESNNSGESTQINEDVEMKIERTTESLVMNTHKPAPSPRYRHNTTFSTRKTSSFERNGPRYTRSVRGSMSLPKNYSKSEQDAVKAIVAKYLSKDTGSASHNTNELLSKSTCRPTYVGWNNITEDSDTDSLSC